MLQNDVLSGIASERNIPDCYGSFSEASLYVIESIDETFNSVLEECGFIDENGVFTEDVDVLNEGLGDIKDRAEEIFGSMWAKIKEWFEKVTAWFKDKVDKAKEFLAGVKAKAEDQYDEYRQGRVEKKIEKIDVSMIPADKKLGKVHKFNIEGSTVSGYFDKVRKAANRIGNEADTQDDVRAIVKALPGDIANKKDCTVVAMKATIVKDSIGDESEVTGAIFKSKYKEYTDVVLYNASAKDIKKMYNEARSFIKLCINLAKKAVNAYKKAKNNDQVAMGRACITGFKACIQILHTVHGVCADTLRKQYNEYMKIVSAAVRATAKGTKDAKKKKKEAAKEDMSFEALFGF